MKKFIQNSILYLLFIFGIFIILFLSYQLAISFITPSLDRNWAKDQKILAEVSFEDNLISIRNIRNNFYRSAEDYDTNYYDKTFDINKLKKVWFVVEPFIGKPGAAHTLVSFEFENDEFVSISAEIRKEVGESFNIWKGIANQYELVYVVADERDVVKLRSNFRKDNVYVYPVKLDKEKGQKLFRDMLTRSEKLRTTPEFYNTVLNSCTTNIVKHANFLTPGKITWNSDILFPATSDEYAYALGLIDTELSFPEVREKFFINERAARYADDPNFSRKIRE